jgi:uncharacterized protein YecE (DUF72 family)
MSRTVEVGPTCNEMAQLTDFVSVLLAQLRKCVQHNKFPRHNNFGMTIDSQSTPKNTADVRIGPAGWSYKDWEGTVYPAHGSRFDALAYLAHYFDTIEVNSSFYRTPPPTHAQSWIRRVLENDAFRFTAKLNRLFTHERAAIDPAEVRAFRRFLDPLAEAGRLGAILVQFPWSARNTEEMRDHMSRLFDAFDSYPLAVEVRHASFEDDGFYGFLNDRNVSIVNIDQPLFSDSVKPSNVVTGPIGYIRLHGRNYEKWFAHAESWERYNYLYAPKELEPWAARIREIAASRETYAITNNHFRGQAIVNALDLKKSLGMPLEVPPQLREAYPERV